MEESKGIVFGQHTAKEAGDMFGHNKSVNPCVDIYGRGPKEKMCKSCTHLVTKTFNRNYYKCDLRENTNGPRTDHRVFWPACAKFEAANP